MNKEELVSLLRLQQIPLVGDLTAKKLIAHCGNAEAVFNERKERILKIDGIGTHTIKGLFDPKYMEAAEYEWEYIQKEKINVCSFQQKEYPENLKHCIDAPILLFTRGKLNFKSARMISIVGTRKITSYGRSFCEQLIEELSPLNPTIVSGLAYGVDICAQKKALELNLQTIGCMAHGLNQIYPKAHEKYAKQIEENGGFITEFWSTSKPDRENFLKRNRIIAGLSEATIVIESAEKGGSLVTAEIANGYNREVFALPGRASDKLSTGCNNLIKKNMAHMITSAADLVYHLNWNLEENTQENKQQELFIQLEGDELKIFNYLQKDGKQLLDVIAIECQIPVFKVSSSLMQLEMKGLIRPLPGKLFEII